MKNRGLSPVIATILLIMLSVASVAIIAGFLIPFVRDSLLKSSECLAYEDYYTFDKSFGYNCYYPSTDGNNIDYAFSIKTATKELNDSDKIKIVLISRAGETKPIEISREINSAKILGGVWMPGQETGLPLKLPGFGGMITYKYRGDNIQYISAEVYPVLKSGRICGNEKDDVVFEICDNTELING